MGLSDKIILDYLEFYRECVPCSMNVIIFVKIEQLSMLDVSEVFNTRLF